MDRRRLDPVSELRAGDRIGRYAIERELGRGGMGAVFLARDETLRRHVALKVIVSTIAANAEVRARFEREARIALTLEHPHVVPVYDVGDIDGRLFIAMRFVDGTDLARELRHVGHLPPERVSRITPTCAPRSTAPTGPALCTAT
jgi:serine/threonine protein kinase